MIKMYLYFGGAFVAQRSAHPPFMSRWKIRFLWHGPTKTPLLICFCVLALSCWFQNILWQTLCVAECFEVFMYCSNTTDLSESTKWKRIIVQPVVPQKKPPKKTPDVKFSVQDTISTNTVSTSIQYYTLYYSRTQWPEVSIAALVLS